MIKIILCLDVVPLKKVTLNMVDTTTEFGTDWIYFEWLMKRQSHYISAPVFIAEKFTEYVLYTYSIAKQTLDSYVKIFPDKDMYFLGKVCPLWGYAFYFLITGVCPPR